MSAWTKKNKQMSEERQDKDMLILLCVWMGTKNVSTLCFSQVNNDFVRYLCLDFISCQAQFLLIEDSLLDHRACIYHIPCWKRFNKGQSIRARGHQALTG